MTEINRVLRELKQHGLLLQSDARFPNVASLFAGEPIRGSWWTHPRAQQIFGGLNKLEDHKDVLFTKLLSGKVTLVHRRLWQDLVTVAISREPWQTRKLSPAAKWLLQTLDTDGGVRSDAVELPTRLRSVKIGDVIRELESRLLIHTEEFHTESGAHAKLLETWPEWSNRAGFKQEFGSSPESKQNLENVVEQLNEAFESKVRLPWA